MPLFSDLRSDYPLHLTLLARPYAGALKRSCRAGLTSACGIPVLLIGSTSWFLSRLLVDRTFDAHHYFGTSGRHCHSVEPRICTGSRTNFRSSACALSAGESTCGLTQVRASVREFQLMSIINGRLQSNTGAHICAATLNSTPASWRLPCCRLSQCYVWLARSMCCPHRDGTRR
jgi:hypothetical protein